MFNFTRAGRWFLCSGIQSAAGGVARYYRIDSQSYLPVSTEITGYAASALVFLHSRTHDSDYRDQAAAAAHFLSDTAWDAHTAALPFELSPDSPTYFFDCGIVVRGLLAVWRMTGHERFLHVAHSIGRAVLRDFVAADGSVHPILAMPAKQPVDRDPLRWSRSPGCYQLKSAMAWWDLAHAAGDDSLREPYEHALESALSSYAGFLPGHPDRLAVMDRLHAFLYFLEGMLPHATRPACTAALADGIGRVQSLVRDLAADFVRSDVLAQLLRIRIYAHAAGAVPLDFEAAQWEAARLMEFQDASDDPRLQGGFYFGRRHGVLVPHVSPVSTAFALQALALWEESGQPAHLHLLI